MTPRAESHFAIAIRDRNRECERALRWEAIARQLGDALASLDDFYFQDIGRNFHDDSIEGRALSVYRDAIKEDG